MSVYSDVQRMAAIRRRIQTITLFFAVYGLAHFAVDSWQAVNVALGWLAVHL